MLRDFLQGLILNELGMPATQDQALSAGTMADFVLSEDAQAVLLLRGYAGTGKTSLVGAFVRTMDRLERPCLLLAPTGRAAKVFSQFAGRPAFTIHKCIYRQRSMEMDTDFSLNYNGRRQTLFIVDEASMVSDVGNSGAERESLLEDLLRFVYAGQHGCRLVLVGDDAQLPPVGETVSPALREEVLRSKGLNVMTAALTQVVRQQEESGILFNATRLRALIGQGGEMAGLPRIRFEGFADVRVVPGDELIETLASCYARDGIDDTRVVCRSNRRCVIYNNGIRVQILSREGTLCAGEEVMVAKNNYYWADRAVLEARANGDSGDEVPDFLANGDMAVVDRVSNVRGLYGFQFADCTLRLPDYDDVTIDCTVLLDTIFAEAPALTREQQQLLYERVMEDYADLATKRERLKALRQDCYYNAVQIKYAYAITCHKAQGGQWSNLFIDQGYLTEDMLDVSYLRWLYTAITRATRRVFFVNWSPAQMGD